MDRIGLFRILGFPFVLVAAGIPVLLAVAGALVLPQEAAHAFRWLLAAAGLSAVATLLAAAWAVRRVRRDLREIGAAVTGMMAAPGQGESPRRVAPLAIGELNELAARINALADDRERRLSEALAWLTEREAVLVSMVEGVLAVDSNHRILNMNPAAARIFGISATAARDRDLLEVVRNTDLRNFIAEALGSQETVEGDILIYDPGERFLRAHGSPLRDGQGRIIGAVIVLDDVSALRRLENVRKDFVANVSHELKTPITSIKGFVETLQGGALQNKNEAERFLEIIARQADRLHAIIEDLLNLSRIERDAEAGDIAREDARLKPLLQAAIQVCEVQAQAKDIRLELECDPALTASISAPLLEQAMVNLIDNAVKYSPNGASVRITAQQNGEETQLRVQDWGAGIEERHQARLFERFYRVDKARSRKLGGTGLGLAIVKHIAQAHGGQATVQSELGRGSTFTLHLPRRAPLPRAAHG